MAIAAGGEHVLALMAEGRVVAWDMHFTDSSHVPMTVPGGLTNVVAYLI